MGSSAEVKDDLSSVNYDASHIELSTARNNINTSTIEHPDLDIEYAGNHDVTTAHDVEKYTEHDDEAMKAMFAFDGEPLVLDEATSRRILKRIDWHIMPVMCFVFALNYLDKTTLSYASVMGFKKDINLVGAEYQWLGSIFYIGFLAWEYPTTRMMQMLPLAKYTGSCIVLWGAILALFATVHNFGGAMAIRFFLGLFEASSMPAFALLSSQWYTYSEHNFRSNIFISSNGWGQIFGGVTAYGIATRVAEHPAKIEGWKIIFIAIGGFTVLIGLIFLLVIPDNQLNCRWLSKRDRLLAIERVKTNEQGIGNKHFKWYQFREAFTDPHTYALFAYGVLSDIPNGGLTTFFSQLIVSFGYTSTQSLLLGIPGGAVVIFACLSNGWAGGYFQNRTLIASIPMACCMIGLLLIVALPSEGQGYSVARLIGYYMTQTNPATGATVLSLISSNVAGYTKKTTVAAFYLIGYCAGNIIGPQTFRPKDAPRYVPAEIIMMICYALCVIDLVFISWWYRRLNKKKTAIRASAEYVQMENHGWRDLTDIENPEFIYRL